MRYSLLAQEGILGRVTILNVAGLAWEQDNSDRAARQTLI